VAVIIDVVYNHAGGRSAPQNNFRRIIAAPIPPETYCFESIKYATEKSTDLDLDLLLAMLNSQIFDWYFRITSSNAQINEYQFNLLPVPTLQESVSSSTVECAIANGKYAEAVKCLQDQLLEPGVLPKSVAAALTSLSQTIQRLEQKRVLQSRSDRSRLSAAGQEIQDAIDAVIFRCYGLSDIEAEYVRSRLEEML
jgi:hypothetical protein